MVSLPSGKTSRLCAESLRFLFFPSAMGPATYFHCHRPAERRSLCGPSSE